MTNVEKELENKDEDWAKDVLEQLQIWKEHYQTSETYTNLFCNMTLIWTRN